MKRKIPKTAATRDQSTANNNFPSKEDFFGAFKEPNKIDRLLFFKKASKITSLNSKNSLRKGLKNE